MKVFSCILNFFFHRRMYYHMTPRKSHSKPPNPQIHVQSSPRPLPRPPTPVRSSISSLDRSLPPRPLPAPPPLPLRSSSPHTDHFQTSLSTSNHQKHKHASVLLTLDTSAEVLSRPSSSKIPLSSSPTSILQAPPTPRTARQKRITKLQRHLGETIPQDLVPLTPVPAPRAHNREMSHPDTVRSKGKGKGNSMIAQRLREFDHEKTHTSDAGSDEEEEELWDPAMALYSAQNSGADPRSSTRTHGTVRQWLWEKAGKRWEEENPADVVRALRSL
ncbi:hypothetical protein J3R30DRAFT_2755562 [Lentinula aciculospora]|uniref:Uncharacterized protein n=1 Tax=Lentinula aciculospora TaxID=153920 RepID=A0A9W9AD09_9AGAR|nr:hypothetical protein J3R30DRAFT_2755562 [Lentinula aciculospora]